MKTIHSLFESNATLEPHGIAILDKRYSVSYQALNKKANQFANYLRSQGVEADTNIALCMERSVELFIAILAILKLGAAYVPLDATHPDDRLSYILKDIASPFLIIQKELQSYLASFSGNKIVFDYDALKYQRVTFDSHPNHSSLAYIIYTSGSTGTPKGVAVEHHSVVEYANWFKNYAELQVQDRIDFSSQYIFDMAVTTSIVPLMLGATVVICDEDTKKNVHPYLSYLQDQKIQLIKMTPSYFKILLEEAKNNRFLLPHLKKIILGGENLTTNVCKEWLNIYPQQTIFNEYGPTEATVAVSQYTLTHPVTMKESSIPIGAPAPHVEWFILNENLQPVKPQEIGELYIGGGCLAREYLNQKALTEQFFIPHPFSKTLGARLYKTGDLCCELSPNILQYKNRIDTQIKIRGFRIEVSEVEKQLLNHPDIQAVAVLAREMHTEEKQLIAYYILHENNTAISNEALRQHLKKQLPDYMVPSIFVRVDAFPLTANGKLDTVALPIPQFTSSQHYQALQSTLEKKLAAIWSSELGITLIGRQDDFFELGGNSLSAARIVSKINSSLKKNLNLKEFYTYPSIAALAPLIKNKKRKTTPKIASQNDIPLRLPLGDFQLLLWMSQTFAPEAKKLNIIARKRLIGRLDIPRLKAAFEAILQKHVILNYRIAQFSPIQAQQKKNQIQLIAHDISQLSTDATETAIENYLLQLLDIYPWPKKTPTFVVNVIFLPDNQTELQLCVPHLFSDEITPELIFAELSYFYLHSTLPKKPVYAFQEYILNEQQYLRTDLQKDLEFWEDYLKDATAFRMPSEEIIPKNIPNHPGYTTFIELSETALTAFKKRCAEDKITINAGLCGAFMRALMHASEPVDNTAQAIYVNIVKSTRNESHYDEALGCFLRLEPLKIQLDKTKTALDLAKQIHQSIIDISPYQRLSSLIKLACLNPIKKITWLNNHLIRFLMFIYTSLARVPAIHPNILNLRERMANFKRNQQFIININIQDFFVMEDVKDDSVLFGLETTPFKSFEHDILTVDSVLEVRFFRETYENLPVLAIASNLQPDFRERIVKEFKHQLESTLSQKPFAVDNIF